MNLILFGAGATYGSGEVLPTPPPLGNHLFSALARLFPLTWGQVSGETKSLFKTNFEHGMAKIISDHSHAIAPLMQHMAIYFSRFSLRRESDNLYIKFIDHLKEENLVSDTLISSLNYECVCEIAASFKELTIDYFDFKDSVNSLSIWKLHGSCNFKMEGLDATRGISYGFGISFQGGIKALNLSEVEPTYSGNTSLFPSMALYAKEKPVMMSPRVISDLQSKWTKYCEGSTTIVIGVKINDEDKHIWEPIENNAGDFYYVGLKDDFDKWTSKKTIGNSTYIGNTWDNCEQEIYKILNGTQHRV